MRGHAAANLVPVVAANRVGREVAGSDESLSMVFYGSSFSWTSMPLLPVAAVSTA